MADRFEELRTFITAISAGGINAAAAEIGIAKSAVSRRVSDLEKRLGMALIDRSSRRFAATAVGVEYARRAHAVLASLDELDASLSPCGERRSLVVSAPAAMISHMLTPALAMAAPVLERERIMLRLSATVLQEGSGSIDVLVAEEAPTARASRHLFSTRPVMCASPAYLSIHGEPGEPRDLDGHPAIAIGDGPRAEWLMAGRTRRAADIAIVTPDADAAAAAAIAGLGIVQLPDFVAAVALADGRLARVLIDVEPKPSRVYAFYAEDAGLEVRHLVDALADALGWHKAGDHAEPAHDAATGG